MIVVDRLGRWQLIVGVSGPHAQVVAGIRRCAATVQG